MASCPSDISTGTDAGICGAVVTYTAPTFNDNCDGSGLAGTLTAGLVSGSTFPLGTTIVTYTYTDAANNGTATCSFNVTVSDSEPPAIAACPSDISTGTDAGICGAVVTYTAPTFNDNCDGSGLAGTLTAGLAPGSTFPLGITIVTYTYTDAANNGTATCSFNVTVSDGEPPAVATCPSDISTGTDAGICGAVVTYTAPTFNDNCDGSGLAGTLTAGLAPGSTFPLGTTIVTYTYTDAANNGTATCSFNVTVSDGEPPAVASCPSDISTGTDAGICGAVVTYTAPTFNDNCDGTGLTGTLTAGLASGSTFPLGTTTVTYTYTDAANNGTATCSFNVTVSDDEPPTVASCPSNISTGVDAGTCEAIVTYTAPTFNDNCDGTGLAGTLTAGLASGATFPVGTTTVTYTYTDAAGNTPATCSFDVVVSDDEVPTITCPTPSNPYNSDPGQCYSVQSFTASASDNCGSTTITYSVGGTPITFPYNFPVGITTVDVTATDAAGNIAPCSFNVEVIDNEYPTIDCSSIDGLTYFADNGDCQFDPPANQNELKFDVYDDNCPGYTVVNNFGDFDGDIIDEVFPVGTHNITWTITDASGLITTCSHTITVIDNQPPVITNCPADITVETDPGLCSSLVTIPDLTYTDNCSNNVITWIMTGDNTDSDTGQIGQYTFNPGTTTISYTVTDEGGNTDVCSFNVIVEDNTPPTALCKDTIIQLDGFGDATISEDAVDNGSDDECGTITFSTDINNFDCSNLGANTVTLSVTDGSGNSATCQAIVTVEDNIDPTAVCRDITVQLDDTGNITIADDAVNGGSTDICNTLIYSTDVTSFNCTNVGINPVQLTVDDGSGNTSTCSANVTVEDNISPNALCKDTTLILDASGNAILTSAHIDAGSFDNCSIDTYTLSTTNFICTDLGNNTVSMTVTDVNGNNDVYVMPLLQ